MLQAGAFTTTITCRLHFILPIIHQPPHPSTCQWKAKKLKEAKIARNKEERAERERQMLLKKQLLAQKKKEEKEREEQERKRREEEERLKRKKAKEALSHPFILKSYSPGDYAASGTGGGGAPLFDTDLVGFVSVFCRSGIV